MENDQLKEEGENIKQNKLKIINLICYIICMATNGQYGANRDLKSITSEWNLTINPAGQAFVIWGLIYTLVGIFIIYQTFPDQQFTSNNNETILTHTHQLISINLLSNAIWLPLFLIDKQWSFIIAFVVISIMLITNVMIMQASSSIKLNWVETVGLRFGFSIQSGWVTAATILNGSFIFKSYGISADNGQNENQIGSLMLWVAFFVQNVAQVQSMNPLYGSVQIWVLAAIRVNNENLIESEEIRQTIQYVGALHLISTVCLSVQIIVQRQRGNHDQGLLK